MTADDENASTADDAFLALLSKSSLHDEEAWRPRPRQGDIDHGESLKSNRLRLESKSEALSAALAAPSVAPAVPFQRAHDLAEEGTKQRPQAPDGARAAVSHLEGAANAVEAVKAAPQRAPLHVRNTGVKKQLVERWVHHNESKSRHHEIMAKRAAAKHSAKTTAAEKKGKPMPTPPDQPSAAPEAAPSSSEPHEAAEELHMHGRIDPHQSEQAIAKELRRRLEEDGFVMHVVAAACH